jgi:hypothetical protein
LSVIMEPSSFARFETANVKLTYNTPMTNSVKHWTRGCAGI